MLLDKSIINYIACYEDYNHNESKYILKYSFDVYIQGARKGTGLCASSNEGAVQMLEQVDLAPGA